MIVFETNIIKPLIIATDDYIKIIKTFPTKEQKRFWIGGVKILNHWKDIHKTVIPLIEAGNVDNKVVVGDLIGYRMALYFYHIALFFQYFGDHKDTAYITSVDYFFRHYKAVIGEKDEKHLFTKSSFRPNEKNKK